MWLAYNKYTGRALQIVSDPTRLGKLNPFVAIVPIPDQDVAPLQDEEGRLNAKFPDDFKTYPEDEVHARLAQVIDASTGSAINTAIHPHVGIEEQIGILRDQLVHVLNALGIEPTEEFAKLNEIAIKEIEAAREKKEALDENDTA